MNINKRESITPQLLNINLTTISPLTSRDSSSNALLTENYRFYHFKIGLRFLLFKVVDLHLLKLLNCTVLMAAYQ